MSFKYIFYLDVEEGKEYLDKKIYASFLPDYEVLYFALRFSG